MRLKYRVYHDEGRKSKLDAILNPLSVARQQDEYIHFPTALRLHYSGRPIVATSDPATPDIDGVLVTLITDQAEHEADSSLSQLLRKLNNEIRGLCLLMEKIPSSN